MKKPPLSCHSGDFFIGVKMKNNEICLKNQLVGQSNVSPAAHAHFPNNP